MKKLALILSLAVGFYAHAYNLNDYVSDHCWDDQNGQAVCLEDTIGNVQVIDFGAGWCGPCNSKMKELGTKVSAYNGKKVTFYSGMIDGWSQGSGADSEFLNEWIEKHNIPASIKVVSMPRSDFIAIAASGGIPRFAILDQDNRLVYRASGPSWSEISAKINQLLSQGPQELPAFLAYKPNFLFE